MLERERGKLSGPAIEELVGTYHKPADFQFVQSCKRCFYLAVTAGTNYMELYPKFASRRLRVPQQRLGKNRIGRINKQRDDIGRRNYLIQQFQPFRPPTAFRVTMPVTLPPGRLRAATNPAATGSVPIAKMMGIVAVVAFAATAAAVLPGVAITDTL